MSVTFKTCSFNSELRIISEGGLLDAATGCALSSDGVWPVSAVTSLSSSSSSSCVVVVTVAVANNIDMSK